jgi:hypothetical protein
MCLHSNWDVETCWKQNAEAKPGEAKSEEKLLYFRKAWRVMRIKKWVNIH